MALASVLLIAAIGAVMVMVPLRSPVTCADVTPPATAVSISSVPCATDSVTVTLAVPASGSENEMPVRTFEVSSSVV